MQILYSMGFLFFIIEHAIIIPNRFSLFIFATKNMINYI